MYLGEIQKLRDKQDELHLTKCKCFAKCSKFMNKYVELGRGDIYRTYIDKYCFSEDRFLCKRKQYFLTYGSMPDDGVTPAGTFSYIQKIFLSDNSKP
jgi:hypothetical protein